MAELEADLLGYYYLMLFGGIGIIAVLIYIIVKILLYVRRKAKEPIRET
jgi:hypothetical protein